jgi:hypothetical protein
MGQRYTNVNILQFALGYLNATMNRNTWKPELAIGTYGSSRTQQNPRVDEYRRRFGPPRCSGSGYWMDLEQKQSLLAVRTRTAGGLTGPVANTSDESGLAIVHWCQQYLKATGCLLNTHDLNEIYCDFILFNIAINTLVPFYHNPISDPTIHCCQARYHKRKTGRLYGHSHRPASYRFVVCIQKK